MDYRVQLDVFNGPLDLLLYLIKRDELDIFDIPIAQITQSYVGFVEQMRGLQKHGIDIDTIGDFLVMAATLMEIKSASLLPTPPPVDTAAAEGSATAALADPRAQLIRQLLEYKQTKDQAALLDAARSRHANRFNRAPAKLSTDTDEPPPIDLDEVQVWDLLKAFNKIMGEIGTRQRVHEIVDDDTPIELHAADIEDRLRRDGTLTLQQILTERRGRAEMVGVFLAVLELIRQKRIIARVAQNAIEPDQAIIEFEIASEDHRKTFTQSVRTPEQAQPQV